MATLNGPDGIAVPDHIAQERAQQENIAQLQQAAASMHLQVMLDIYAGAVANLVSVGDQFDAEGLKKLMEQADRAAWVFVEDRLPIRRTK